jgi:putative flippase GtrA
MNVQRYATFARFLIAGGFNTLFGWLVYSLAIIAGFSPWLALIFSTLAGIVFNFFSLGGYAFRDLSSRRLPRFLLTYAIVYASNLVCLKLIKGWIPDPILAQLILTPPIAILSYVLLSRAVFTR